MAYELSTAKNAKNLSFDQTSLETLVSGQSVRMKCLINNRA